MDWLIIIRPTRNKLIGILLFLLLFGIPFYAKLCWSDFAGMTSDEIGEFDRDCQMKDHDSLLLRPIWGWDRQPRESFSLHYRFNLHAVIAAYAAIYLAAGVLEAALTIIMGRLEGKGRN